MQMAIEHYIFLYVGRPLAWFKYQKVVLSNELLYVFCLFSEGAY